jgi:predicted amidohydrolase YtcJ
MADQIIITNGRIYQGHGKVLGGQSLFVNGLTFGQIAPLSELRETYGKVREIDLQGGMVIPGLVDSHLHLAQLAAYLQSVDCELPSKADLLQCVRQKAASATTEWLLGYGWNQNLWNPPVFGTAADIDSISADKAVVLFAKSLHALWANTKAMHLAGINNETPDLAGGAILRLEDGTPSGVFLENAMTLIEKAMPELPTEQLTDWIDQTQDYLLSMGITGVHDFDRFESYEALKSLENAGRLHLRVVKNLPADQLDKVLDNDYRQSLTTKHLKPGWIKAFADGALGPQSAAMFAPYEGTTDKGMLLLTRHEILEIGKRASKQNWPLAVHAIGDAANHEVLEGYQLLRAFETKEGYPALPHRIEHVQCMAPSDQELMKSLGIIASVQPVHATSDMFTASKHWGNRCAYAYPYRSLLDRDIPCLYGSDAPVESANPFLGIHAAVTRRKLTGEPGKDGWYPEQRLSLSEALDGFSLYPNQLVGFTDALALKEGSVATMVLLGEDLYNIDPQAIAKVKPLMSIVEGEIRYES